MEALIRAFTTGGRLSSNNCLSSSTLTKGLQGMKAVKKSQMKEFDEPGVRLGAVTHEPKITFISFYRHGPSTGILWEFERGSRRVSNVPKMRESNGLIRQVVAPTLITLLRKKKDLRSYYIRITIWFEDIKVDYHGKSLWKITRCSHLMNDINNFGTKSI